MRNERSGRGGDPPPLSLYRTCWKCRAGSEWQAGLDFALGFTWDCGLGDRTPQPVVNLMGLDVTPNAALTVDEDRCLVVEIDFTNIGDIICRDAAGIYLQCIAKLSADGRSFAGRITQICAGAVDYVWRGQCASPPAEWFQALNFWVAARVEQYVRQAPVRGHDCKSAGGRL